MQSISIQIKDIKAARDKDIEQINANANKQIEKLQSAYDVNSQLNEACLFCEGTGKVSYTNYQETTTEFCSHCNGTGRKTQ